MRFPHSMLLVACIALFPGMAWSQGGGGGAGAGGAGSGAAGAGAAGPGGGRGGVGTSAISGGNAVGGGAPAGAVGGGAPAGAVGGGAPTSSAMTPAAPGFDPNAAVPNSAAANPSSAGAVVGGPTGTGTPSSAQSSGTFSQGGAPPIMGQAQPAAAPPEVRGVIEFPPATTTGLATVAADGVSTKVVPARPCSTAARETDGTTTCVGIPSRRK
jgi:hypothetical protein